MDEHVGDQGGMNAVLDLRAVCTNCNLQKDAFTFCHECNAYMCEDCNLCHKQLTFLADHQVLFMTDIASGRDSIQQQTERCKKHGSENKDLFCEECKIHICFKCVIVGHRDHKIKNQEDFETELRTKVDDLLQRCTAKKTDLEKSIQKTEIMRQDVHVAVQKLEDEVKDAYEKKAKRLKENERALLEEIKSLQKKINGEFDAIKTHDRQQIKSIVNSVTLIANDRLGRLETDSLSAHSLLCEELETLLGEATNVTSAKHVQEAAKCHRFRPASDEFLDLGICTDVLRIRVTKEVNLRGTISGMAAMSSKSVLIGYTATALDLEQIDVNGNINCFRSNFSYNCDFAFERNNVVCSTGGYLYKLNRNNTSNFERVNNIGHSGKISSNHQEEIILANKTIIKVYGPSCRNLKCTIKTNETAIQAFETKSGAIVSSSCNETPSVIKSMTGTGRQGVL